MIIKNNNSYLLFSCTLVTCILIDLTLSRLIVLCVARIMLTLILFDKARHRYNNHETIVHDRRTRSSIFGNIFGGARGERIKFNRFSAMMFISIINSRLGQTTRFERISRIRSNNR